MNLQALPKREREVMDLVYLLEQADVRDIQQQLAGEPTYSATRMLLQRLHKKGLLQAERDGNRYIYRTTTPKSFAGIAALKGLIGTFFSGSASHAVSALLGDEDVSDEELEELEHLVKQARLQRRGER